MLQFFDPDTRQLLRVRANALTRDQVLRLFRARRPATTTLVEPAGHRAAPGGQHRGVILVCRQRVNLAVRAGQIVTVAVSETT